MSFRTHRWILGATAALLVALPAHGFAAEGANIVQREGGSGGFVGSQIANWSGGSFFFPGIGLWATTLWNAYHAKQGERPERGWLVAGYVFSGLGAGMGGLLLASANGNPAALAAGAFNIAHAAADLFFTIWAQTKPARMTEGVSVRPIGGTDLAGGAYAGIGLTFTSR